MPSHPDRVRRIYHNCDENCRSCVDCYIETGNTICDQTCKHSGPNWDTKVIDINIQRDIKNLFK